MGERTSAAVSSRTSMPQEKWAANAEARIRDTNSYATKVPDVALIYERTELQSSPQNIAYLLAKDRTVEEWGEIRNLATHQPLYNKAPTLDMPGLDLERTPAATVQASALMLADEQPAAGSCPCLPCNLL